MRDRYMEAWHSLGLLDPENAPEGTYFSDDERRYIAFRDSFSQRSIDASDLQPLISLIEMEPSESTRDAMFRLVIGRGSDDVLHRLFDSQYRQFVEEELALRALNRPLAEDDLVELAQIPSKKVQAKVLERPGISSSVLAMLVEKGVTRAIRNQANSKLGRKGPASSRNEE